MFIQVVQGKCTRQDEMTEMTERWRRELAPGARGWLGTTYGFTDDDKFVAVVRFESEEAARANSERPEQGSWAEEMSALVDGPIEFHDCPDVTLMMDGGSDDAGFVQVIRGKADDADRLKAMMTDSQMLQEARPEILGATLAFESDGTFTETVAFSDEDAARQGEKGEMPDDVREALESSMHDVSYMDLRHPTFASSSS
jgi:hypothetical protein